MADGMFNIGRGRVRQYIAAANSSFGVLLLQSGQDPDETLADYDDVGALLAAANNTEADFTNYTRKTGIQPTDTVDDVNNVANADFSDQTWTDAGGTSDNDLGKLVVFFEEDGADANRIPVTHHDFVISTNGNDLTAQLGANGFWSSS